MARIARLPHAALRAWRTCDAASLLPMTAIYGGGGARAISSSGGRQRSDPSQPAPAPFLAPGPGSHPGSSGGAGPLRVFAPGAGDAAAAAGGGVHMAAAGLGQENGPGSAVGRLPSSHYEYS